MSELTDQMIATMDRALGFRKTMLARIIAEEERKPSEQETSELEMIAQAQKWLLDKQLSSIAI